MADDAEGDAWDESQHSVAPVDHYTGTHRSPNSCPNASCSAPLPLAPVSTRSSSASAGVEEPLDRVPLATGRSGQVHRGWVSYMRTATASPEMAVSAATA